MGGEKSGYRSAGLGKTTEGGRNEIEQQIDQVGGSRCLLAKERRDTYVLQ